MSPDETYRLHTDWARAVTREESPHAAWFEDRLKAHCQPIGGPLNASPGNSFRTLGDRLTLADQHRMGLSVQTRFVLGARWNEPDPDAPPADVFSAPPGPETDEPETQRVGDGSRLLMVPEHVYVETTRRALAAAATYYVTADMVTVMEVAAAAFDEFDRMPRMPAPSGFVVLARPLMLPLGDGTMQPVRAFAWNCWVQVETNDGTQGTVGEIITFASRARDDRFFMVDDARRQWPSKKSWREDPDLLPCYVDPFVTGASVGPLTDQASDVHATSRAREWLADQSLRTLPHLDEDAATMASERLYVAAQARYDQFRAEAEEQKPGAVLGRAQPYLAAFVMLLTQQITVTRPEKASAGAVSLAHRVASKRPAQVTVVDVRSSQRPAREDHDRVEQAARAPLTHRHLVGSHWKWQPYGKDRALRRRTFVSGYVRGPGDAPLVVKPRVTRLS